MQHLLAVALVALAALPATAGPLSVPGAPALEPATLVPAGSTLLAVGGDGVIYDSNGITLEFHHLDDPDAYGSLDYDVLGAAPFGMTLVGLAHDGLSLYVLRTHATLPQPGAPTLGHLYRVVGADQLGVDFSKDVQHLGPVTCGASDCVGLYEPTEGGSVRRLFGLSDGTLALLSQQGALRLDPTALTLSPLIGPADLNAAAPVPAWAPTRLLPPWSPALDPAGAGPQATAWSLSGATHLPDGRVAFLASQHFGEPYLRYVLALDASGALAVLAGPFAQAVAPDPQHPAVKHPLVGATSLAYDATLNALLAGPVLTLDYSHLRIDIQGGDGAGNPVSGDLGWTGASAHVLPLAGGPTAHWNLTDALVRRYRCQWGGYVHGCDAGAAPILLSGPGGQVLVGLTQTGPDAGLQLARLIYDPATLDLDADGLTAAEEATFGTSDFNPDSDGGGTPDGAERVAGTDPADASDDPAHALPRHLSYITSTAIRQRLPDVTFLDVATFGAAGPLCAQGACYAADGSIVHTYAPQDDEHQGRAARSVDGRYLVLNRPDRLERHDLTTGQVDTLVSRAQLDALLGPAGTGRAVVPVDRDLTFVVQQHAPVRVAVAGGLDDRLVFDLEDLRCADGLGPCDVGPKPIAPNLHGKSGGGLPGGGPPAWDDLPVHDVVTDSAHLIGFDATSGRLLLGLEGTYETWVVAIHPTAPPLVVARQDALVVYFENTWGGFVPRPAFPAHAQPTGFAEVFTEFGVRGPHGEVVPTHLEHFGRLDAVAAAWGDTLLFHVYAWSAEDGLYELVRYERRLAPGEQVRLASRWVERQVEAYAFATVEAWALQHSGPRGGWADLWPQPNHDLVGPSGLDVTSDGRLCVADRGGFTLWEWAPSPDGTRLPAYPAPLLERTPALDCAYDPDGRLYVQLDGGPILVREGPDAPFTEHPALTSELAAHPGRRLQRDQDGAVVLGTALGDEGELTATVPGGFARDPWTGQPLPATGPGGPDPVDPLDPVDPPAIPSPPTGGDPIDVDQGCAAGSPLRHAWPLGLALLALAFRRRHPHRGCR